MVTTKKTFPRNVLRLAALILTAGTTARTQNVSPKPAATMHKLAPKPHVVWTEDNVSSLRSPADTYIKQKEAPVAEARTENVQAAGSQAASTKSTAPARLSNPKTVESADEMIAWEDRDIDAQQEYVARLRAELQQAPADQKDHLKRLLQQREQILADTRREKADLVAQKRLLQKKPAANDQPRHP